MRTSPRIAHNKRPSKTRRLVSALTVLIVFAAALVIGLTTHGVPLALGLPLAVLGALAVDAVHFGFRR